MNPHIVPFAFERRGSPGCPTRRDGSGLRGGFLFSAAETLLKLDMRKWLRMISELDLMPILFSQVLSENDKHLLFSSLQLSKSRFKSHFSGLVEPFSAKTLGQCDYLSNPRLASVVRYCPYRFKPNISSNEDLYRDWRTMYISED